MLAKALMIKILLIKALVPIIIPKEPYKFQKINCIYSFFCRMKLVLMLYGVVSLSKTCRKKGQSASLWNIKVHELLLNDQKKKHELLLYHYIINE